jgi:hypothetical protein
MKEKKWIRLLAYVTGLVNQELLLKNEYLAAENPDFAGTPAWPRKIPIGSSQNPWRRDCSASNGNPAKASGCLCPILCPVCTQRGCHGFATCGIELVGKPLSDKHL